MATCGIHHGSVRWIACRIQGCCLAGMGNVAADVAMNAADIILVPKLADYV